MTKSYWFFHRRKELKLNQTRLAERLSKEGFDVSPATVSAWETGRHNPPMHDPLFRRAFAKALELEIPEMLKMAGYEIESSTNKTHSETVFITYMRESARDLALAIAKSLSEKFGFEVVVEINEETMDDIKELVEKGEPFPPLNLDITVDKKKLARLKP